MEEIAQWNLPVLVRDEVQALLGDVVDTGEVMLMAYGPQEAFLVTGDFALWLCSLNDRIEVGYIIPAEDKSIQAHSLTPVYDAGIVKV